MKSSSPVVGEELFCLWKLLEVERGMNQIFSYFCSAIAGLAVLAYAC